MTVMIVGRRNEGWQVVMRGWGWLTRSNLLTRREACSLAAYCMKHNQDARMRAEKRGW